MELKDQCSDTWLESGCLKKQSDRFGDFYSTFPKDTDCGLQQQLPTSISLEDFDCIMYL